MAWYGTQYVHNTDIERCQCCLVNGLHFIRSDSCDFLRFSVPDSSQYFGTFRQASKVVVLQLLFLFILFFFQYKIRHFRTLASPVK